MFSYLIDFMVTLGLGHPMSRAISFACVGFALQYFLKPKISYVSVAKDAKGNTTSVPKEFILTSTNQAQNLKTWFPWYMWPATGALIGGLFF